MCCVICYERLPLLRFATLWEVVRHTENEDDAPQWRPHHDCKAWLCHSCVGEMQWRGFEYALTEVGPPAFVNVLCPLCRTGVSVAATERLGTKGLLRLVTSQTRELRKLDIIQDVLRGDYEDVVADDEPP